jgi:DNA-binding winged helix-turn-helix (wHTH) protein
MVESLTYDDGYLAIALDRRQILLRREPVHLTATEYGILAELVRNEGRVVAHRQILEVVWGEAYTDAVNYVHVYVRRLRQKLEQDPSHPRYLMTVRGIGYRFEGHDTAVEEAHSEGGSLGVNRSVHPAHGRGPRTVVYRVDGGHYGARVSD